MTTPTRIFIIGHTGARKSLIGEALAKRLGWRYIDANPGLERYIGKNLPEIMGDAGAAAFHQCEAEIIAHYCMQDQVVVVLEEAVATTANNRQLLATELVIYLTVSVEEQLQRWPTGRTPLLPIADVSAFLTKQHHERDTDFSAIAKLTVASGEAAATVEQIMQLLAS